MLTLLEIWTVSWVDAAWITKAFPGICLSEAVVRVATNEYCKWENKGWSVCGVTIGQWAIRHPRRSWDLSVSPGGLGGLRKGHGGGRHAGFRGDGGAWLWSLWRRRAGQLPNRLSAHRGGHGASTATSLPPWRRALPWALCPRCPARAWARARDCCPALQCHAHTGWIRTREVREKHSANVALECRLIAWEQIRLADIFGLWNYGGFASEKEEEKHKQYGSEKWWECFESSQLLTDLIHYCFQVITERLSNFFQIFYSNVIVSFLNF